MCIYIYAYTLEEDLSFIIGQVDDSGLLTNLDVLASDMGHRLQEARALVQKIQAPEWDVDPKLHLTGLALKV